MTTPITNPETTEVVSYTPAARIEVIYRAAMAAAIEGGAA